MSPHHCKTNTIGYKMCDSIEIWYSIYQLGSSGWVWCPPYAGKAKSVGRGVGQGDDAEKYVWKGMYVCVGGGERSRRTAQLSGHLTTLVYCIYHNAHTVQWSIMQ